jgi:hypothetical protein
MDETEELKSSFEQGELCQLLFSFTWINPSRIEAGEFIMPAKLSSEAARKFAALHLILDDMRFAEECLNEADCIGLPDGKNFRSRALIHSGVVAYARCFKGGVRALTLKPKELIVKGAPFDSHIHHYMIALRDKHIAHSVNDFEECNAVAIMIGKPDSGWHDGSGIGVTKRQNVGITRTLIRKAISHINALRLFLESELPAQREALHSEFASNLAQTGKWEWAPLTEISDRSKVAEKRK